MTEEEDSLRTRVRLLLFLGQLPIVLFAPALAYWVRSEHGAGAGELEKLGLALLTAFASFVFSSIALVTRRPAWANLWLTTSLVSAVGCLHILIALSGGSRASLYVGLYFYVPVVVFMTSVRRLTLEIFSVMLVLASYIINYTSVPDSAWREFMKAQPQYRYVETGFTAFLLVMTLVLNHLLELGAKRESANRKSAQEEPQPRQGAGLP